MASIHSSEQDNAESSFGVSNYEKKVEMSEKVKENELDFAEASTEFGTFVRDFITRDLPQSAAKTFTVMKNNFTPGFISRMNQKKIHIKHVEDTEKVLENLKENTAETMQRELAHKKAAKEQDRIIRELLTAKKHLRDEVREVLHAAKADQVESQFQDYHRRRGLQLVELNARIMKEKRDRREAEEQAALAKRLWTIEYYGQQARELGAEAATRSESRVRELRNKESLDRTFDEFEQRQRDRTRLQVDGIASGDDRVQLAGGSALGVFAQVIAGGDLYLEDVDQHDVHVFSAPPLAVYETTHVEGLDKSARLAAEQALYDALQHETRSLRTSIEQMADMRDLLERDQRQITQEVRIIETDQLGPPRRLPAAHEIPATDLWKNRAVAVANRMRELQYTVDKAESKMRGAETQSLSVAQSVAALKESVRQSAVEAEAVNGELGMLPMVVGRSLDRVPGIGQMARPREMLQAVTHQSRLVEVREQSLHAAQLHRDRNALDQEVWLTRLEESGRQSDLDSVVSRLVGISDRLQRSAVDAMRLNIIDSLRGFLASGLKLNPVHRKIMGLLPWFLHHDYQLSSGVQRFVTNNVMGGLSFEVDDGQQSSAGTDGGDDSQSATGTDASSAEAFHNGVTLGDQRSGFCCGVVQLPKNTLWSVLVTITRQYVPQPVSGADSQPGGSSSSSSCNNDCSSSAAREPERVADPSDFVSVKMGPTVASMSAMGTFFNRVNPLTGTVLYDVRYIFRGSSFAFRFDFSSSSARACDHLAVCPGIYEEFEMKPLEFVSDPRGAGRQRVLSSFVKMLRIEESTGSLRETRLLEELIAIEADTSAKVWDSAIVSQTLQRYSREYFLRILRAEILLQQDAGNAALLQRKAEQAASKGLLANADLQAEARLEASLKKYTAKKRSVQRRVLDDGQDMVGKRLILWDPEAARWRNITVTGCRVKWVENGLVAQVTHSVQEFDDGHEPLGDPMEVDLRAFKYFESPVQVVDPQSIARWRERKRWDDSIRAIQERADAEVARHERAFLKVKKREERRLRRAQRSAKELFDSTIDANAELVASKPAAQRALKVTYDRVILDIRKGIVHVDDLATTAQKKALAAAEAKKRFVDTYVADQRLALDIQLQLREQDANDTIADAQAVFDEQRDKIRTAADAQTETIKRLIRAQMAKRKKVLLQKVRFDPAVFKTVVPVAANCEHLKTKAWGDSYGKGVKCVHCGKELSELFKEESQLRGYGSGSDPALHEAVVRHRENEQSFRFKSSEELALVERERRRLEKERREMDEAECYFYDLQDLRAIYEFDHRHARTIKAHGVFRQGLQWTEDELAFFEETRRIREKVRLEREGLPESLLDQYDPLAFVEEPPPTFRAADERRRAQYNELLFAIGRLHNFSRRIHGYKLVRFELLSERELFSLVLEALHKDSYAFEAALAGLERDLDKTSRLLSTFHAMQLLWAQANHIQNQARRDKAKAEMARCGVWEAVAESRDAASMVRDETRSLLRAKLLLDAKLDNQVKAVEYRSQYLEVCRRKFEEKEQHLIALRYCAPGSLVYTRYGQCYVCYYRQTDDMLMVTLPWGRPPAKAYVHYKEVMALERSRQRSEVLLMGQEDEATGRFQAAERVLLKRERYGMQRAEEGLREYHEFCDLGANEASAMQGAITAAVDEAFAVSESKTYRRLQGLRVKQALAKTIDMRRARRKDYIGPPSGRPRAMGTWEVYSQRKAIELELKQKFILDAANRAESGTATSLHETRSAWAQNYAFQQLIDGVIGEMIADLAEEAHSEGRVAKGFAEKKSGIMFPQPPWMQYGTYNSLASIWRARKDELRHRIEVNKGMSAKILAAAADPASKKRRTKLDPAELLQLREARRLRKIEKERQAAMCQEMACEERAARDFYRWELLENLRERRRMREEDRLSLQMRKDEEKARLEAESLYAVIATRPGQTVAQAAAEAASRKDLSYERRRAELKELTLERRRRAEDQAFMTIEDSLSAALREVDRLERQKRAFAQEFGEDEEDAWEDGDSDGSEEDAGGGGSPAGLASAKGAQSGKIGAGSSSKKRRRKKRTPEELDKLAKKTALRVPKWLALPNAFALWDVLKQNRFVRMMTAVRAKTRQRDRNVEKELKRLARMEAKSAREWELRFRVAEQAQLESELAMMEADEDAKDAQAKLLDVRENMMRILIYCREKGEDELHARSELKRLQEVARRRDRELEEAAAWLDLCVRRSKNRDKLKRRVSSDCKWVDTDSINGFHQRFATERLREKLYYTYFRQIVASVVNRAEIIATERYLMSLQVRLSVNKAQLVDRTDAMKALLVEIRREERMRMRRSFLNERFFPRMRRKMLQERFGGWVRYYLWNRGHKEAFQLKYEVIKRQLDIDRQFRQQLRGTSAAEEMAKKAESAPIPTIMQKHRERLVQCKACLRGYLESQNTSNSCQYHPKQFILECPRSCPNPGLTDQCIAHRKRRWTCCDAVRQDSTGCSRRHHCPPDVDPVYETVMARINERDRDMLADLDAQWEVAAQHDWPARANAAKRGQVFAIEDRLEEARRTADRFMDLKFV